MILKNLVKANRINTKETRASRKLVYCLYWLTETEPPESDFHRIAELLLQDAAHLHSFDDLDEMEQAVLTQLKARFSPVRLCEFCCFLSYNSFREMLEDLIEQTAGAE